MKEAAGTPKRSTYGFGYVGRQSHRVVYAHCPIGGAECCLLPQSRGPFLRDLPMKRGISKHPALSSKHECIALLAFSVSEVSQVSGPIANKYTICLGFTLRQCKYSYISVCIVVKCCFFFNFGDIYHIQDHFLGTFVSIKGRNP